MTKVELLRSVLTSIKNGETYTTWKLKACVRFRLFANPLEKQLREFIVELAARSEGKTLLPIIFGMKGLPHTLVEKPRPEFIAADLQGKAVDFMGRPLPKDKGFKPSRKASSPKIGNSIGANSADRRYVVSQRKK